MKKMGIGGFVVAWAALSCCFSIARAEELPGAKGIGETVPNSHSLRDLRGNSRQLHDFAGHKAIVLVFVGTECPISKLYLPSIVGMEKRYRPKQVQFLAVYPNEQEDLDQMAAHAYDMGVPFPVLKDEGQKLAALAGAARVPTIVVLDGKFKLSYRGRVDDRYGSSFRRKEATRADLALALDEVLAGKAVSVPETEVEGCLVSRSRKSPMKTEVTFAKNVAPILQNHCQSCHREGQGTPFTLMNYDDAVAHAEMIREVTTERRMPPWQADPRYGHFSNDRRCSQTELDALTTWIDTGLKRGDDKDLPKPVAWPQGWAHGEPDMILTMPEEYQVPADGVVDYKNWIIETNFKEDKWVRMAEGRPGTPGVIHHIVVYIMREGQRGPVGPMEHLPFWSVGLRAIWAWFARPIRPCAFPRGPAAFRNALHAQWESRQGPLFGRYHVCR